MNVSIQGKNVNILTRCEKINGFQEKLQLWCRRVRRENLSNFPSLEEIFDNNPSLCEKIVDHLEILTKLFDGNFKVSELKTSETDYKPLYSFNLDNMSNDEELNLLELYTNRVLYSLKRMA